MDDTVEKSTEKLRDQQDKEGKFVKGNTLGNCFSKDNQPENHPGRPQTRALTDALLRHLEEKADHFEFTKTACTKLGLIASETSVIEVLMASSLLHGMRGKGDILKEMWSRIEGSVPKTLNLKGDAFDDYLDAMRGRTQFQPSDLVTNGNPITEGDNGADA